MRSGNNELPTVTGRMEAGQMLLRGAPLNEVADALQLSIATVRKYRALVQHGGLDALEQLGGGGHTSVLDDAAPEWIAVALNGPARAHGFPSEAWTSVRLRELIGTRFGVLYSRVYPWKLAAKPGLGYRLTKSRR